MLRDPATWVAVAFLLFIGLGIYLKVPAMLAKMLDEPFFDQFEDARRQMAFAETIDLLGPALRDSAGRWSADYVRLRVEARLAGSQ